MVRVWVHGLIVGLIFAFVGGACAQESASRPHQGTDSVGGRTTEPSTVESGDSLDDEGQKGSDIDEPLSLFDRLLRVTSHKEDPDGPINTDRPTFTPANTVVPRGRLQFESGWTVSAERTSQMRATVGDLPELAARYGLTDRLEFRMFWSGETFSGERVRRRPPLRSIDGPGDTEVGFKWQLFPGDEERKWIPTTALITSVIAPTGGSSPYSSETVEPYVNPLYG